MAQKSFYPHLVVGNIVQVPTDTVENLLVSYQLSQSPFISDLTTASTNGEPLTTFETIAKNYLDNDADALNEKAELIILFPQFNKLVEMLTTNDPNDLQNPSPETFNIIASEAKLWDNAIAHFITNKIASLTNDLILSVHLVGLLKKIQDGTLNNKPKVLSFWKKSHIVLPKPPFPLPKKIIEEPTPPIIAPDSEFEKLLEELHLLQNAREDLISVYEFQIQKLKKVKLKEDVFKTSIKLTIDEDKLRNNNIKNTIDIDLDQAFKDYNEAPFAEELTDEFFNQMGKKLSSAFAKLGISC